MTPTRVRPIPLRRPARLRAAVLATWLLVVDQDTLIGAAVEVVTLVFLGLVLLGLLTGGLS